MRVDLSGKIIVVTGGTQGLGEAIALKAAQCNAAGVAICGRSGENGDRVQKIVEAAGAPCLFVKADLSLAEDAFRVVDAAAERFGALHGLVNAAASTERGTLADTSVELWDRIMNLNVRAPFLLMQRCLPHMKKAGGGSVVNILSVSGHGGQPYLTAYSTSKGALAVLTKNVAHAHRQNRIRFNGLNIGWMATPNEHLVQKAMGKSDDWLAKAESEMPFGRILRPVDVSNLTAYLLSDDAEMMTGSIIDFDQNVFGAYD
jgi:NAD(P)-dependent dehydrogenase (short-subunit alcohol dehydrogenase family)